GDRHAVEVAVLALRLLGPDPGVVQLRRGRRAVAARVLGQREARIDEGAPPGRARGRHAQRAGLGPGGVAVELAQQVARSGDIVVLLAVFGKFVRNRGRSCWWWRWWWWRRRGRRRYHRCYCRGRIAAGLVGSRAKLARRPRGAVVLALLLLPSLLPIHRCC
ncbi:unnamed protein product, partial [Ectocarpus fasciculatus]